MGIKLSKSSNELMKRNSTEIKKTSNTVGKTFGETEISMRTDANDKSSRVVVSLPTNSPVTNLQPKRLRQKRFERLQKLLKSSFITTGPVGNTRLVSYFPSSSKGNAAMGGEMKRRERLQQVSEWINTSEINSSILVKKSPTRDHHLSDEEQSSMMADASVENPLTFTTVQTLPSKLLTTVEEATAAVQSYFPVVIRIPSDKTVATASIRFEAFRGARLPMMCSGEDFFAFTNLPSGKQPYDIDVTPKGFVTGSANTVGVTMGSEPESFCAMKGTLSLQPRGSAQRFPLSELLANRNQQQDPNAIGRLPLSRLDLNYDELPWGSEDCRFEETRKFPPVAPTQLRYTPLHVAPGLMDARLSLRSSLHVWRGSFPTTEALDRNHEDEQDTEFVQKPYPCSFGHLPLPLSVTLGHVYLQRRSDHVVMGVTLRCREKFVSTVYYKPTLQAV